MNKIYILFLIGILWISLAIQLSTDGIVENLVTPTFVGASKSRDTGGTTVGIILGCVAISILILFIVNLLDIYISNYN